LTSVATAVHGGKRVLNPGGKKGKSWEKGKGAKGGNSGARRRGKRLY